MPKCVDCGTETDRSEMYGPPDELRCPACVSKLRERLDQVYSPVRGTAAPDQPYAVYLIMGLAVALTLAYWNQTPFVLTYLLPSPFPIWDGELWRLVTSTFIHGNILHLLFNLYWIRQFGTVLENWMGTLRFVGFFVLMALASSAAQFQFDAGGIGLSGVVYAMFGLLYALHRDKDFAAAQMQPGVAQVFVGWFVICIVTTMADVWHVGNVAHGAGALFGWLTGLAVLQRRRVPWLAGLTALLLALTASTLYMPWSGEWAWHRGTVALKNGDLPTAMHWFRKAAAAHPNNAGLQNFVRQLENAPPGKEDDPEVE